MPTSPADAVAVSPARLRAWPLPTADGDKEDRGRILVIGGSRNTPGAVRLAAEAALRAGAGKLQVATVASLAPHLAVAVPEALVRGLPESPSGAIATGAAVALAELAAEASAVLVGPGLSGDDEAAELVLGLLARLEGPVVLDALALAAVTADPGCLAHLQGAAVLTPNDRELGLTLGQEEDGAGLDPAAAAQALAISTGAVVTSGGEESWTADPTGDLWVDRAGNPGLAVSGSGDVRAGIVAGLLARGSAPAQAAVWGTHVHKRAGDRLAAITGPVGFLARELGAQVPLALAAIEHGRPAAESPPVPSG